MRLLYYHRNLNLSSTRCRKFLTAYCVLKAFDDAVSGRRTRACFVVAELQNKGDTVTAVKEKRAQQMFQADEDYRDTVAPAKEERGRHGSEYTLFRFWNNRKPY